MRFYQFLSQTVRSLYSNRQGTVLLMLMALCVSCSQKKSPDLELELSVKPASRPGAYTVSGTSNLPDQSQIAVAAIRYLRPTQQPLFGSNPLGTYSILDRQVVEVNEQGQWQARLNLWEVAPDGRLQEAWQINQSQGRFSVSPNNSVSFLATYEPYGHLGRAEEQQPQIPEMEGDLVRFNNDGQPYVKASYTLPIALPSGRKSVPSIRAAERNGGWGNRSELKPQPSVSGSIRPQTNLKNQNNTPLSPSEFFR
ncbi:hypothetical protein BI334_14585 [Moorena producens 3L]|nr:hypothetical protein BI334_14585 [Moorena producens 3L]